MRCPRGENPSIMEENGPTISSMTERGRPVSSIASPEHGHDSVGKQGFTLTLGAVGEADAGFAGSPWFVKEGDTWYMFYVTSATMSGPPELIGLSPYNSMQATAKSLRGPWTKSRGFVPGGRWDSGDDGVPRPYRERQRGDLMFFGAGQYRHGKDKDLDAKWDILPGQSLIWAITISKTRRST